MWIDPNTLKIYRDIYEVKVDFRNVSFPPEPTDENVAFVGLLPFVLTAPPSTDRITEVAEETTPAEVNGAWTQQWAVRAATASEQAEAKAALQKEVVDATQKRLDDFAKTREYDGILSACTYSTSPTTKFATEGQYCVEQRDATWAKLYEMLAEVEAGTRPIPQSFADIEPELPALVWPV
jgi:hypothetical protein